MKMTTEQWQIRTLAKLAWIGTIGGVAMGFLAGLMWAHLLGMCP